VSALACVLWSLGVPAPASAQSCPPPSHSLADLQDLRGRGFTLEGAGARDSLALALLDCLADPDPSLRDGIAFEALSTWMRAGLISRGAASAVLDTLLPRIAPAYRDAEGFARPFSALVLAEVARMDRIEPFLTPARRDALVDGVVAFLPSVDDYRGFDAREGWRHGVAHGADLVMQLALNPQVDTNALGRMLDALGTQVAPRGEHFYVYGEPMRLARAVFYLASRDLLSDSDWAEWLMRVTDPAPLGDWGQAFASQAGLAKRHNTTDFLLALHLLVSEDGSAFTDRIAPALAEALRGLP
jgi:hypothetical protein